MKNPKLINCYLFISLVFVTFISLIFVGRYNINVKDIIFLKFEDLEKFKYILLNVRLPRLIGAILVGAALSTSGATYQAVFKNPMVSPDILGASSGSAFGIALSIINHYDYTTTLLVAFFMGIIAVSLSYFISNLFMKDKKFALVLSGIMVSTVFSSLLSFVKLIADIDNELPDITYWLMGRLSGVSYKGLEFSIVPFFLGFLIVIILRWRINLFTIGTDEIYTLGINVKRTRFLLIMGATLLTTITVSICGIIGFVGLVIPHFSRLLVGNNYKNLVCTVILGGALFMILIDNLARTLSTYEVPLGILTSVVGAPIFLILMMRERYA